jgi:hypothetical protein
MLISTKTPTVNIARTRIIPAQLAGRDFLSDERTYVEKMIEMFGSSLIGFWPLTEQSGLVAENMVKSYAGNGVYSNCLVGNILGPRDGKFAPTFIPASLSFVNLYSAGLSALFTAGIQFCSSIWMRISSAVWADGVVRFGSYLYLNGNNYATIAKRNTVNRIRSEYRAGGAVALSIDWDGITTTNWINISTNFGLNAQQFLNGTPGVPQVTAGLWAGGLGANTTCLGTSSVAAPVNVFDGQEAYYMIINRPITQSEALAIYLA